ncbi:deoxyuridine 5'-triphosphate nucleotidohydrolase [Powellomyces hirtus]|nr:deoxyuridine 5'-triphosphate nucleotidohydrolase [Powellomyces hirtus]
MLSSTTQPSEAIDPSKRAGVMTPDGSAAKKVKEADTEVVVPPQNAPLLVKRLTEKGRLPTRGSPFAAGYDIYSAKTTTLPPHSRAVVPTDISIAVPAGTYGRVAPRSGLAVKHFVDVGAGVIDADYRGPLGIVLFNFGENSFEIKEGDRIAQLVLEKIVNPEVMEVESLDDTIRGEGGFGSTGVSL